MTKTIVSVIIWILALAAIWDRYIKPRIVTPPAEVVQDFKRLPDVSIMTFTITIDNAPVQEVFRQITNQSRFFFVYCDNRVQMVQPVTIHLVGASLDDVMHLALAGYPLTYVVRDGAIVIQYTGHQVNHHPLIIPALSVAPDQYQFYENSAVCW